jgi:hypothetical protein
MVSAPVDGEESEASQGDVSAFLAESLTEGMLDAMPPRYDHSILTICLKVFDTQ